MTKLKVGKGFLIAQIVLAGLGLLTLFLTMGTLGLVETMIKDLLIEAGGDVDGISNPLVFLIENIQTLENVEILDSADLAALDALSLKVIYASFLFIKGLLITAVALCVIGLVLVIIALVLANKATSKKSLVAPMVLSFVSILFIGLLSVVPGILFACVKNEDFAIID